MLKRDIPPGIDLIKGRELAWLLTDFLDNPATLVSTAPECSYSGVVHPWCGKKTDGMMLRNFVIWDFSVISNIPKFTLGMIFGIFKSSSKLVKVMKIMVRVKCHIFKSKWCSKWYSRWCSRWCGKWCSNLEIKSKKPPSKPWKSHAAGYKNQIWNNNWEKCKNLNA